jgi:dipeptidyl aminopeptidase/acylaminoacyl peptidase
VVVLVDAYGAGDHVLYLRHDSASQSELLFGTPLQERRAGFEVVPNSTRDCHFVDADRSLLFITSLFDDAYGLGTLSLDGAGEPMPVKVLGARHSGTGELQELDHLTGDRFLVGYNIDGCDWVYEGSYDPAARRVELDRLLVGQGALSGGIVKGRHYDKSSDRHVFAYTTAITPTQLHTVEGPDRTTVRSHTRERVLGIPAGWMSSGEDASFTSYDGLRISARLYRPPQDLGFAGPRPLVYYIHGGPQSQEHPDFAWFSMPLIQMLVLSGFAVFVPNVRGSTGYGYDYMNRVVRDWGGADRLDHVHALTAVLPSDAGIDTGRVGVVGRSYGGFMTLTLASRHPELWSAAVDMFGPYDLLSFGDRIPETWKPFMAFLLGDPVADRDMLVERSPSTYLDQIQCPLLVIQGKNDPRVVETESAALVDRLREAGKDVEYLMFPDEGHDVLKYENRVRCYNAIVDFFKARV